MSFAPSFHWLQRETLLAEATLADGLTAARNATLNNPGRLYTGFFNLSIGLERLLKLVLVIDFMVQHEFNGPKNEWLRNFGHDLEELYEQVRRLPLESGVVPEIVIDSIESKLLLFLSRFAKGARYYNLDALADSAGGFDPLAEWQGILQHVLEQDVPQRLRERVGWEAAQFAHLLKDRMHVIAHGLDRRSLDLESALRDPALQQLAARYLIVRAFNIIGPLRKVLYRLGHRGYAVAQSHDDGLMHIPDMGDMLLFAADDRATILRKKRWP